MPPKDFRQRQGLIGEAELIRRLAEREALDLYRPFPDLEGIDIAVRHMTTHRVVGLQVKTIGIDLSTHGGEVSVRAASFEPEADRWFVSLAWDRDRSRFSSGVLLIPAADLEALATKSLDTLEFKWHPEHEGPALRRYLVSIEELAAAIEALVAAG